MNVPLGDWNLGNVELGRLDIRVWRVAWFYIERGVLVNDSAGSFIYIVSFIISKVLLHVLFSPFLSGEWANPGGTAMPGQLVTEPEQAPELHPLTKISLISKRTHGPRIRY